jgi:hypothetical protein
MLGASVGMNRKGVSKGKRGPFTGDMRLKDNVQVMGIGESRLLRRKIFEVTSIHCW